MLKWEFVSLETVIIVLHAGIFWILLWRERKLICRVDGSSWSSFL